MRLADRYAFRWTYSALNAADYFREATLFDGVKADPRMSEAIEMIRAAQQPDGTWLQTGRQPGRVGSRRMHPWVNHQSG